MQQLLYLLLVLTIISCQEEEHHSEVQHVPGEDTSMAVTLGQGLDHLTWQPKGACVKIDELQTTSGASNGSSASIQVYELDSLTKLRKHLNVSASASLKMGLLGNPSGRAEMLHNFTQNDYSYSVLLHVLVGNQIELASDFHFNEAAQQLLQNARDDYASFLKACGTQFVHGRRTGGELFAILQFTSHSREEKKQLKAEIKASGLFGVLSGGSEFTEIVESFRHIRETKVSIYRIGGAGSFPAPQNIRQFARDFPTMVEKLSNQFVTLELLTRDYSSVKPFHLAPPTEYNFIYELLIDELASKREQVAEYLEALRRIKQNPAAYASTLDLNLMDQWVKELKVYDVKLRTLAVKFFSKRIKVEDVVIPKGPFAHIQLPAPVQVIKANPRFLTNFYGDADLRQCNGGFYGMQNVEFGQWTTPVRIDTDGRSGGCIQQFAIHDPDHALEGLQVAVNFYPDGDGGQCNQPGKRLIPIVTGRGHQPNNWQIWSRPYRIDADGRSGGCQQEFSIAGRDDVSLDLSFLADGDGGQCGNQGTHTVRAGAPVRLRIDTDGRSGGCLQAFRVRLH